MPEAKRDAAELMAAHVRIPDDVVVRDFAEEAVVLNLRTGRYHGLNRVAARMLETLTQHSRAGEAVSPLSQEFEQPQEVIERDLAQLIGGLADRGLIELGPAGER